VGQACIEYGSIFRRARGLFISMRDRGHIKEVLRNWPYEDVRVIVVTDGERILGLGDLGANGMGIPVGKLSLYTGCAGIHPATCLPITIDVGTNNESLRTHPMYIGLSEARLRGEMFDDIMNEFLASAHEVFPDAMIQLEDFGNADAFRLLSEYRHRYCLFDDDIQGTAGVVLAGMYSSLRITGGKLSDHRFLFVGAGQAGIGTGDLLVAAMVAEGMDAKDARERCWFMDSKGLLVASRSNLTEQKDRYAHEGTFVETPLEAVEMLKPTVLIGASGKPRTFSTDILKLMAKHTERPVIFALSNPTANSECTAEEAYTHTEGRAIFATGSPFPPFSYGGKTFVPGQANNSYIFPGVGLDVIAARARHVPDEMFFAAAQTLAHEVSNDDLDVGRIYPPLSRIRDVSAKIATAVAKVAIERGLSDLTLTGALEDDIRRHMYEPEYKPYV
jgi:malate dehydrogenase (oxaloacetate-decarboxylating)(NADP+)